MDEVFTLTRYNSDSHIEDFVYSSSCILDILDRMYENGGGINDYKIYVTCFEENSIPYKEKFDKIQKICNKASTITQFVGGTEVKEELN